MFRNQQSFHIIFASAMRQDYSISPAMIGAQPGVVWPYDDSTSVLAFTDKNPLNVSHCRCSAAGICLWYVSPLIQLTASSTVSYALLGEQNKWTAISRQRIVSIDNQTINHIAIITLQGAPGERVSFSIFHTKMLSVTVTCQMSTDIGQARIIITTSSVDCA